MLLLIFSLINILFILKFNLIFYYYKIKQYLFFCNLKLFFYNKKLKIKRISQLTYSK